MRFSRVTNARGIMVNCALALAVIMGACGGMSAHDSAASSGASGSRPSTEAGGSYQSSPTQSGGSGAPSGKSLGQGGSGGSSAGSAASPGFAAAPDANTNVSLGGSQDFGYFRRLLDSNRVPTPGDFDAAGFFAEHHTKLPPPVCGQRVCLQAMLAVLGNLATGSSCTMLQIGLNSPLVADPQMRPPLNLAVSVDVSGSMNVGGKIDFVRAGLERLVDALRDTDKIAIITYSDRVSTLFPMAEAGLRRAQLRELVRGLQATGGTALYAGLRSAYEEALKHYDSGRQNRVILLSDGQPTVGITSTSEIMAMSKGYNSEGVGLTTIGLGTDFNPQLMRGLAEQADGNFYFLESSAAVSEVFTEEVSYFTVPVAFDLKVELEAGSPYKFGRAYGSPFWKDSGSAGGSLEVPSVFLAHRKSHADQTADGGRRGGGSALLIELMPKLASDDGSGVSQSEVARITFSFREPGTNQMVSDEVVVSYPYAPWFTPERGFFQSPDVPIIQKSFVMLNIFIAIEEACRRFHQRDFREILGDLRRLRAAVEDYNRRAQDMDIEADLRLLDQFMAVLRNNGVMDPSEVRIPANPWPAD
jgi:Ca-activated chloride channel homolog